MPKMQSTAAQHARRDARAGLKYTAALRSHSEAPPRQGPIVQFLSAPWHENGGIGMAIAEAWARAGLNVLLLNDWEPERPSRPMRRVKGRWITEEAPTPPGPHSVLRRHPAQGRGLLAELNMEWYDGQTGAGRRTDQPVREALGQAWEHFDIVVLDRDLPLGLWRPCRLADHFIAVVAVSDLPRVERRMRTNGTERTAHKRHLSPQQSAAVLRERHLRFLEGHDVAVHGVVCSGHIQAQAVDPVFYAEVAQDMDDSGIPLLAWLTPSDRPDMSGAPRTDEGTSTPYDDAARKILDVLPELADRVLAP